MNRDGDKNRIFYSRWLVVLGSLFVLTLIIITRLFFLQVIEADKYRIMADENRLSVKMSAAPRGLIFDTRGRPLASNIQVYRVLLVVEQTTGLDQTLALINRFVPLSDSDIARVYREAKRKKPFIPITVIDNITWEQVQILQLHSADLPGVIIDEGLSRVYSHPYEFAHLIGYVAPLDDSDIERLGDKVLDIPNYRIGKLGLESYYDSLLQGTPGENRVEVNSSGRIIRELESIPPTAGQALTLTIDAELQQYIVQRFGQETGAAIVMDIDNGEVLAMASIPSFDPNTFNMGITTAQWNAFQNAEDAPLINKPISGLYSPGSTFKMIVALAALHAGVISEQTRVFCPGYLDLGNHRLHCWKHSGHGSISLVRAIAESCDVYFYEVARKVGIDKIADMALRFGFGRTHTLEFSQEKSGHVPTRAWKEGRYGTPWQPGETMVVGIGQSYLLTTPMQLVVMTAMLARDGLPIRPKFVKNMDYQDTTLPYVDLPAKFWKAIKQGMYGVNNTQGGTAFHVTDLGIPGVKMSGKTGTTQVRRVSMKERAAGYDARKVPRKERNHALYVGYAPADQPKFALVVVVEHGVSGGGVAAPLARDIMRKTMRLYLDNVRKTDNAPSSPAP